MDVLAVHTRHRESENSCLKRQLGIEIISKYKNPNMMEKSLLMRHIISFLGGYCSSFEGFFIYGKFLI